MKNYFVKYKKIIVISIWGILNILVLIGIGYYLLNRLTGEMIFQVGLMQVQNINYIPNKGYLSHTFKVNLIVTNGTNRDLTIPYTQFQITGARKLYPNTIEINGSPYSSLFLKRGQSENVVLIYQLKDLATEYTFVIPSIDNSKAISIPIKSSK